jgi:hypothetical protein
MASMMRTQLLLLGLIAAIGCEQPVDEVQFELYAAGRDTLPQQLFNGQAGDVIEMVILRASDPVGTQTAVTLSTKDGTGRLPVLPYADDYWFYARGFDGADPNSPPYFYGAASNVTLSADTPPVVSLQVGQSNCVGLNLSSTLNRDINGSDDMKSGRVGATATALPDGRILFIGGGTANMDGSIDTVLDTMEVYDPSRGQFIGLPTRLDMPRAHHTATLLADGRILIFGGITAMDNGTPRLTASAAIINLNVLPAVQPITSPPDSEGRYLHRAVRLNDPQQTVLITGGTSAAGNHLATTWRYFPGVGTEPGRFVQQGDLWVPRSWHSANRIQHDPELALIAGGISASGVIADSEVFTLRQGMVGCADPMQSPTAEVGCFQKLGSDLGLGEARFGHAAIEVDRGRQVLFVGGFATEDRANFAQQLELVDRDLKRAQAGTLETGRGELTANLLPNGDVIVLGGRRGDTAMTASDLLRAQKDGNGDTARYAVAGLSAECDLSEPRYGHQAVTTPSGTVLVGGGLTASGALSLVSRRGEIYFPIITDIPTVYPRLQ